jgi:hypothetical protein
MAQFTLKQLLLAMTCFAVSFAGLGVFCQARMELSDFESVLYPCMLAGGMIAGVGALRGDFWIYLALAILVPVVICVINLATATIY